MCRMNFKSSGVSKYAQYLCIFYNMLNGPAVILLVEKIACLLTIFNIHQKLQAVFMYDQCRYAVSPCCASSKPISSSF